MTKRNRKLLAALLCAASVLALVACAADTKDDAPVDSGEALGVAVQTQTVRLDAVSSDSTVTGTVSADGQATVMVAVTAKVLDTYVEAGDTVEEGQVLCRLELDSTLSNYRAAQLNLKAAQQSYNDQAAIFNQQIAALEDQVALAEKQVPLAEQQVPLAEQQIPQLEQQIGALQDQIALLEQQETLAQKQVNDLNALFEIGAASQAEIDAAALQLSQVQIQITQARLQADQAKLQLDQANLSISQSQMQPDQARLSVEQAKLQLASAVAQKNSTLSQLQAGVESARSTVQQMASALSNIDGAGNVVAPMRGILASFNATKDGYVSTSAPVAIITGDGDMEILASVSESLIPRLNIGDEADVTVAALGESFPATIKAKEQTANQMTRLYTVTLAVPSEVKGLLAGMFADVTFHTDRIDSALMVPSDAILTSGETQYVFVVDRDKAVYTEVKTGRTGDGVTQITEGLHEGQELVTVGQSYLHDGDAVRIVGGA